MSSETQKNEVSYPFPPRLLSWDEAAYYAGTCVTHIRELAKKGKIDISKRNSGAHPKIFRESLDKWIDSTKINYKEVVQNAVRPKNFDKNLASVKASNGNNNP